MDVILNNANDSTDINIIKYSNEVSNVFCGYENTVIIIIILLLLIIGNSEGLFIYNYFNIYILQYVYKCY